jgi:hypothetical protein
MGTESWEFFWTDTQFHQKFVLQFFCADFFIYTRIGDEKQGLEGETNAERQGDFTTHNFNFSPRTSKNLWMPPRTPAPIQLGRLPVSPGFQPHFLA